MCSSERLVKDDSPACAGPMCKILPIGPEAWASGKQASKQAAQAVIAHGDDQRFDARGYAGHQRVFPVQVILYRQSPCLTVRYAPGVAHRSIVDNAILSSVQLVDTVSPAI